MGHAVRTSCLLNLFHYGDGEYSEKNNQHQVRRKVGFPASLDSVFGNLKQREYMAAFDPDDIPRSGKGAYGMEAVQQILELFYKNALSRK